MNQRLVKALLARPIDLEIYRKASPSFIYWVPWSISMPIMAALIAWCIWGPQ